MIVHDIAPAGERLLVILPCHNEAGRVGGVIRALRATYPAATVLVVDDASADASGAEARAAGAHVLTHAVNLGYGAALETGYLYARRHGFSAVLQMDSDGQHLPGELARILAPLRAGQADIVIGSRYGLDDAPPPAWGIRRLGHVVLAAMVRLLCGLTLRDPTSGFQALNQRALVMLASGVFPCDYPDSDVILMAHMAGLRIREVPVRMLPRSGGRSMHAGLKPFYYAIKMLLSMFIVLISVRTWHRWRHQLGDLPGSPAGPAAANREECV